jgi:hypothetical protein
MWWIDIDDAVPIYARMVGARLGSHRGAKAALEKADHLRAKGDWSGVQAGEAVAAELPPPNQIEMRIRCPACQKYHWWNCTRAWVVESPRPT